MIAVAALTVLTYAGAVWRYHLGGVLGFVLAFAGAAVIIEAISPHLEQPMERFFVNVDRYGNTSAASIPLALDEARRSGRIKAGDVTLLVAFGAGLTYGSALIRW